MATLIDVGASIPSINSLHSQIVPALNKAGDNCANGFAFGTLPDFSTLNFRNYNFEKVMVALEMGALQQLATSYAFMSPMATFVGGTLSSLIPAIPGIPGFTMVDILNVQPSIITNITSNIPGTGLINFASPLAAVSGSTIVNTIIDDLIDTPPDLGSLLSYGLSPLTLNTSMPPEIQALMSFQQIMKNYTTFDLTTAILDLVTQVVDILVISDLSVPTLPTFASLFSLLEARMDIVVPQFPTLWALKSDIDSLIGRTLASKRDLFVTLATVKSTSETTLKSVQAEILRREGREVSLDDVPSDPATNSIMSDLFPTLPTAAQVKTLYDTACLINFPVSVSSLFNINIPVFGTLLPTFPEPLIPMGTDFTEYNFDPDGLAEATRREVQYYEYEFIRAWDSLTSEFANFNYTSILSFVTDNFSSVFGFAMPQLNVTLTC